MGRREGKRPRRIWEDHIKTDLRDYNRGRDSADGLDGPGIDSRWGARFCKPVQTGPGDHPASYKMDTWSFPGVKRPGRGVDHPPHLSPRSKEEERYTCFPSGPVLGRTLPLLLPSRNYTGGGSGLIWLRVGTSGGLL